MSENKNLDRWKLPLICSFGKTSVVHVALLLVCLFSSAVCLATKKPKHQTVSGYVVAYEGSLMCLNGNSYWSMIIRVRDPKKVKSEFVRVHFSSPCDQPPEWPTSKVMQKFRLIREKDDDHVLTEFMECVDESDTITPCPDLRLWHFLPGNEGEELPFGQIIPSYRSADPPLAPVV